MMAFLAGSTGRLRRRAAALVLIAASSSAGCALVPTWDDIDRVTATVSDKVTGKGRRDRQIKIYSEARLMERRKEFAHAETLYRELLKEEPQSRDCYHRLAVMAALQGKFDEANALYQSAIDVNRPTADLMSDVGYCYYLQHQLPQAEQALKKAIELEPQHRAALNNLAMVVGEAGNLDEAYRLFRRGNPDAEAEANFAYLCAQCGDLERSQTHYSRALSYNPELRIAVEGLMQVTNQMQIQLDQTEAAQQTAQVDPQTGEVQQVAYDQPQDAKPRRQLIEVYAAGMPRPKSSTTSNSGAVAELAAAQAAAPVEAAPTQTYNPGPTAAQNNNGNGNNHAAPPSQPPFGFGQPQPVGQMPGSNMSAPRPYSFQSQPQPQYLQPTTQMQNGGSNMNAGAGGNTNASQASRSGDLLSAGGPFPPLVGGASAMR